MAIIGSSGNLLNENHGELIDSYDNIIRFNRAKFQIDIVVVLDQNDIKVLTIMFLITLTSLNMVIQILQKISLKNYDTNILYAGPDDGPWSGKNKKYINLILYLSLIIQN